MKSRDYCYLAGSMESVSEQYMKEWRSQATAMLAEKGIDTLDPTRRVSFHDQIGKLEEVQRNMNICRRIYKMDLQDIAYSRVVLADVRRSSGKGTGTAMELQHAHHKHKIIVLWADEDDYPHPFFEAIYTEKHFSLEDAINAIKSYY